MRGGGCLAGGLGMHATGDNNMGDMLFCFFASLSLSRTRKLYRVLFAMMLQSDA